MALTFITLPFAMTKTVVITGFGVLGPLGRGPDATSAALRAGTSGIISMRPAWAEFGLRSQVAGLVDPAPYRDSFDRRQIRFMADAAILAATAMRDAISHAGLTAKEVESPRTGLILGTGAGASLPEAIAMGDRARQRGGSKVGPFQVPLIMGSTLSANLGSIFHIHGHAYSVTSACATSAHAALIGLDLIRSGRLDRVFVGGAESVDAFSASSFDGMGALSSAYNDNPPRASRPLDRNRDGFVYSGGAGILVLESLEIARSRGASPHAILRGAAATCDGDDMVAPNGIGAEAAMRLAIEDAAITPRDIDYINLHGTSTPVGDLVEIDAIRRVFGPRAPAFSSTKSMTGHGLGAAGVLEAIYSILMMRDRFLAPNINLDDPEPGVADLPVVRTTAFAEPSIILSNSFGFGGTNCSLILSLP